MIRLSLQSAQTTIDVRATRPVANIESSTIGGLVDGEAITSLPLASRNYTQILGLSPGVIADLPTVTTLGNGTQNVAAQGATPLSNNIQFNGIDANNILENSAAGAQNYETGTAIPAPDSIEEFRVQTANYDAGYGRGSGANIDIVSRTGGNQLHGDVWEFVRNNIFNANDFFSKLHGQPRADLKQNQFGAAVGGKLLRDRDFFFVAYQGTRQVNGLGTSRTATLPLLTSDRSATALGAQFCPATHLDGQGQAALGYQTNAGGTQVTCDGSNISPVALALLNAKLPNGQFAVPAPQIPLVATGPNASDQLPVGTSTFHPPAYYNEDQYSANLDETLTARNTLSQRFFYANGTTTLPFSPNGANVPGWGTDASSKNLLFSLADTHIASPSLTNIARFGYTRYEGLAAAENPLSATSLGIGTPTGPAVAGANMPSISVGGFTVGDGGTPSEWSVTDTFLGQDTVALTKGRNNARFGVEVKYHQVSEDQPQQVDGNLMIASLPDFLLGQSAAQNNSPLGLSNVSLSISGGGIFRRDERYRDLAAFAQDDFKLTPRLTLNVGLRYEIFGAPSDVHGRLTNFDPTQALQGVLPDSGVLNGFSVASNFPGDVPAGVTRTSYSSYYKTPHGDVSPRFGFVWQATQTPVIVVRGGAGLYYDRHSGNLPEAMLGQLPFAISQFNSGAPNGPATLQNPFVPLTPSASSFPIFQPLVNFGFPFIEGINPNIKDGRTAEYNFNIQYEAGRSTLVQVGYVGTRSDHRSGQLEFDQALLASPGNPVNGQTVNTSDNAFLRMPFQGLSPGSLLTDSVFEANFNALEASILRRLSHGLEFQVSYTWSKNLDEVNGEGGTDTFELQLPTNDQFHLRQSSYGLANDDRAQRLVINAVWNTPHVHTGPAALRHIANDWQFSGIALIQSGAALSVFDGNAGSVYSLLGGEVRAQVVPHASPSTKGSLFDRVVSGRYLDATAFQRAPQAPNSSSIADEDFGNSGVGLVRGPGQHNLDFAVERIFPLREQLKLSFRSEFFNLTNTPQFGNPNNNLGYGNPLQPAVASQSFGLILGEQGGPHPRIIQLAAKLRF
ncbi:Oar protein [Granulicella sibirica]|uniref:Oar protein n=1 Tax=Granulicella sibirica TaxID=2479048 RepID=A0A4Q0SYT3_9BACT|nr:Oar protein [Granulicella sibirica]